jgi:hypothetical protein
MKDDQYPKFQWSRFVGANRSEQIVIRGDNWKEITDGIEEVAEYIDLVEATTAPVAVKDPTEDWTQRDDVPQSNMTKCEVCGQPMEFKTGTSKAGKPWKGYFCTSGEKHPVVWIR